MSRRFGLLIGINDYAVNALDYCVNDVNKIEEVLIKNCQFNKNDIRIITSDSDNSNKEITRLFYNALESISKDFAQGEDTLFFFFSGHGVHHEEATLLFHTQEIKVSQIYTAVRDQLNPKNQIFVFDACHSGEKIKSAEEDFMTELYWNKLASKSETKTIIAASRFDQKATEKSVFQSGTLTHYFLKAVITEQNYNNLGFITPSVIADYVRREVSLDKHFKQIPYTNSVDVGSYPLAFSKYLQTGYKAEELPELKTPENNKEKNAKEKTVTRIAPTVLFYDRLTKAFPGVRGVKWFQGKAAVDGLNRFLHEPLRYDVAEGYGVFADPIWWFRGGSASSISNYKNLRDNKILLNNNDELIINKIAVYNSSSYYASFIYIETLPDEPSGLYDIQASVFESQVARRGYYSESFGIYNDSIITYEECEDGAAFIDGEYTELTNRQYRTRYLSKYNIILVPKSSPHNTNQGNLLGIQFMNSILRGERTLEEFAEEYDLLPRNHMD